MESLLTFINHKRNEKYFLIDMFRKDIGTEISILYKGPSFPISVNLLCNSVKQDFSKFICFAWFKPFLNLLSFHFNCIRTLFLITVNGWNEPMADTYVRLGTYAAFKWLLMIEPSINYIIWRRRSGVTGLPPPARGLIRTLHISYQTRDCQEVGPQGIA